MSPETSCAASQSTLMSMLLVTSAAAQSPLLKNVDLCNGVDRTSAEPQIAGCTALIELGMWEIRKH